MLPFMSARSIASATVSFGLVSIPVKLYATGQAQSDVSFHMLHRECGTRLKQQYICPKDEVVVPREDMTKGYEFAKGKYVTFSPEELKSLEEVGNQTIEIVEFVPIEAIDPVYFDKSYWLGTDKGGEKAYRLLGDVMRETGRCAIATYAARGKAYLVLIRPEKETGLAMQQLRYADEVRPFSEVPVGDAQVKDSELKLATQIVDQLARETFDPTPFEDTVKKRALAMIQKKVDEGQEITSEPAEAPRGQIIDLMEALKASLSAKRGGQAAADEDEDDSARKPPRRAASHGDGEAEAPKAAHGHAKAKRTRAAK
jgi:DNA end-binding protein Ku